MLLPYAKDARSLRFEYPSWPCPVTQTCRIIKGAQCKVEHYNLLTVQRYQCYKLRIECGEFKWDLSSGWIANSFSLSDFTCPDTITFDKMKKSASSGCRNKNSAWTKMVSTDLIGNTTSLLLCTMDGRCCILWSLF
jgi:hypothetical protein